MLSVSVSEDKVSVKTVSTVNCVLGGNSDPVEFSTTAAPSGTGTLTLELVKKVKAKTTDADPSAGVTKVGTKYAFGVGKLSGFFYLDCATSKLATPPAAKLTYKLDGTSKASYKMTNSELTVNMVKPVAKDATAKMAVTTAKSGNSPA